MIGAIAGDIIGSVYEFDNIKTTDFPLFSDKSRFTDDTVLTTAIADSIINGKDYVKSLKYWGRKYPNSGYGSSFAIWLDSDNSEPYGSYGNGSAMRVSPVGYAFNTLDEVLEQALLSAEVTHNHPEGIKGAQSTASAIFLARHGKDKKYIKEFIEGNFGYDLDRKLDEIRPKYKFNETCQRTVPEAIIAFLESENYEDAIRKAVSLGGDSDTLACITGGIAQAFYKGVPEYIATEAKNRLTSELLEIVVEFEKLYL